MSRLIWEPGQYETGVERGVLYPAHGYGEVWNGLISVQESPSEGGTSARYRDGIKFGHKRIIEQFSSSVEAYTYPEWILERKEFGLSYRVASKIHLIYNVRAYLNDRNYKMNEHTPFTINLSARPIPIPEAKPSAHLIVETEKAYPQTVTMLENFLYGTEDQVAELPLPEDIYEIFEANSILKVIDNGDGSFTIEGPDEAIQMLDDTTFEITWPSAVYIDEESYTIQSL